MMRGAKPVEVQELLGHASLTMTMRYAHLSPSARRAAAELLDEEPPTSGVMNAAALEPDGSFQT